MIKFIIRWAINAVALYIAAWLITGVDLDPNDYVSFIWLALISPLYHLSAFILYSFTSI